MFNTFLLLLPSFYFFFFLTDGIVFGWRLAQSIFTKTTNMRLVLCSDRMNVYLTNLWLFAVVVWPANMAPLCCAVCCVWREIASRLACAKWLAKWSKCLSFDDRRRAGEKNRVFVENFAIRGSLLSSTSSTPFQHVVSLNFMALIVANEWNKKRRKRKEVYWILNKSLKFAFSCLLAC